MDGSDEIEAIVTAADAWARALDVVAEAERRRDIPSDELDRIEAAEILLYAAILDWRSANPRSRH